MIIVKNMNNYVLDILILKEIDIKDDELVIKGGGMSLCLV